MKKSRVLVVDDSASMRQLISAVLNSAPDMEVVGHAADPLEARQAIKDLSPDVVTLDRAERTFDVAEVRFVENGAAWW